MSEYIMLISAALLLAVDFTINKIYQQLCGTSPEQGLKFNMLLGLFTAIIFFFINGCQVSFTPYSGITASLMGGLIVCYNLIGFRLLKMGTVVLYTLFLMTGGMVMPYLWGILFMDEQFSVLRTIGLLFILSAVILTNINKQKTNWKQICMCVAVFILNGTVSIVSKLHQVESVYQTVNSGEFVMLGGLFKFVLCLILYLFLKGKTASDKPNKKSALLIIAASALVSGVSYMLQLMGAKSLPATVLYPFITGGSMIFSAICGRIIFKEKLSANIAASIALCFVGTLMFL